MFIVTHFIGILVILLFSSAVVAQTSGNLMRFKDRIVFGQEEPIEQVRIFDDRTKVRVDLGIENSTSR